MTSIDPTSEWSSEDDRYLGLTLEWASHARTLGEVPVGAVLVRDGVILGTGFNQPISRHDPSAHAELVALREAGARMGNYRLPGSTLYVSLEPCAMCAMALLHARVSRVVYATPDPKTGAAGSILDLFGYAALNHHTRVERAPADWAGRASEQLKDFFRDRRALQRRTKTLGSGRHDVESDGGPNG